MNIADILENYEATKTLGTNSEEFLQSFKLCVEYSGTCSGDVKDEN